MGLREKRHIGVELFRYLSVGVIVVTAQFSILSFLVEVIDLNPTLSSAIAYVLSTVINYVLQYHYTFRAKDKHWRVFSRYFVVTGSALLLNVLIFWVANEVFGLWYLFSQMCALVIVTSYNFILGRHFTFG